MRSRLHVEHELTVLITLSEAHKVVVYSKNDRRTPLTALC